MHLLFNSMSQNHNSRIDLYAASNVSKWAAYHDSEGQTLRETSQEAEIASGENANLVLTPQDIAMKRAKEIRERLATAHEGWALAAHALVEGGLLQQCSNTMEEMREFGDTIVGRYTTATFLWRVLEDMPTKSWFGPGKHFDDTLRRLRTLKGLEKSLECWEKVVLDLIDFVDARKEVDTDETPYHVVKDTLKGWRYGMPRTS